MAVHAFVEKRSKFFWGILGASLLALIGLADYFTGFEISLTFFYLVPIGLCAWFINGRAGLIMAVASALTWLLADYSGGLQYSNSSIFIWNVLIRVGFLTVIAFLLSTVRKDYRANQISARTDFVTGAVNPRYFYKMAQAEINRARQYEHPLSIVYLDMDNFKQINDTLGHSTGDEVLRSVVDGIQQQIRSMDVIARMGGDEFTFLLPETGQDAAKKVVTRIHDGLLKKMLQNRWEVTFSIGVVTFKRIPETVDEMVKIADQTMYQVKNTTKNGVSYLLVE